MSSRISSISSVDGLYDAMRAAGLEYRGAIAWNTAKVQRYAPEDGGKRSSSKHAWYMAHDDAEGICVTFGSWRDGCQHIWFPEGQKKREISDEDRKRIAAAKREADEEKRVQVKIARQKAGRLWDSLPTVGESPYLDRKRVGPHGIRYATNIPRERFGWEEGRSNLTGIVVPGWEILDGGELDIQTLQIIFADGSKYFFRGQEMSGACHIIGDLENAKRILICEGYSTGATLFETCGLPVVVAFNAGNLLAVAKIIRKRYPSAMLTICGDDDRWHEPGKKNAGREYATAAAGEVQIGYLFPSFPDDTVGSKPTDFNDLALLQGGDEVRRQVAGEPVVALTDDAAPVDPSAGRVVVDDVDHMIQYLVLLYGSDLVWDGYNKQLLKISQVREGYPQNFKTWRVSDRKVVRWKDVVFEPWHTRSRHGTVNLFTGITMRPVPGDCGLICDLLSLICGRDPEILHWVTAWLAYPLQNVGAKMHTALVVHGKVQGTGKTIFFKDIMQRIYGVWGTSITQTQIQSQYTGWLSQRLFVVANEISQPKDLAGIRGPLKQMISDDEFPIEEKFMPVRHESNCANMVFVGNSATAPVPIEADDRRYMCVRFENKQPDAYYDSVTKQAREGGVEAFYDYLLNYDLKGFARSTKPISTVDRSEMMQAAKMPSQRFIEEWLDGSTQFPRTPAPAIFLYDAYKKWCSDNGERSTSNIHFARQIVDDIQKSDVRFYIPQFTVSEHGYLNEVLGKTTRSHLYLPQGFDQSALTGDAVRTYATEWAETLLADAAIKKRMRT